MSIKVISSGLLSTIQDKGRFGVMKNGFSQNGAMDAFSMQTANLLVGNCLNCAVIEMTVMGITVEFTKDYVVALSGGDFSPKINEKGIDTNRAYFVKAGDVLKTEYCKNGMRCYLAVSGGINVPFVMKSRSTNLKSSIGGYFGRTLKDGDIIETDKYNLPVDDIEKRFTEPFHYDDEIKVRAVAGPEDYMFTEKDMKTFFSAQYTVTNESDRMGIRLDGPTLEGKGGMDIISNAIAFGSVQIPKNGKPIILMADHQTTGGYAKAATVISADLPLLAQAKPGSKITFVRVTAKEAEKAAKKQQKYFDKLFYKFA